MQSYGDLINPVCVDSGFTPSPSAPRTCQDNGQWSGQEPTCVPRITCNTLPGITNGHYNNSYADNSPYYYNHAITPICDNGYYIDGPIVTRKCISINTWSENDVECLRITCSNPNQTYYGQYNGSQQSYGQTSVVIAAAVGWIFLGVILLLIVMFYVR